MSDHIPIACTLDAGEARARWQEWAKLSPANRLVDISPTRLEFHFPEPVHARLTELVAAERDCCGFLDWELEESGDDLVLTVSGEEMGLAAIAAQFGVASPD
jgi:hypothetical protein